MEINEIKKCINNWKTIVNDSTELKNYLSIASSFSYKNIYSTTKNIHVYPGVNFETKTFYMFLIDEELDKNQKYSSENVIQVNLGSLLSLRSSIPTSIALTRIENWNEKRDIWIDKQVKSGEGLFLAFNLPSAYMELDAEYETYFALQDNPESFSGYDADLITTKKEYFDVVRPVPPFPPTSFNLLG